MHSQKQSSLLAHPVYNISHMQQSNNTDIYN